MWETLQAPAGPTGGGRRASSKRKGPKGRDAPPSDFLQKCKWKRILPQGAARAEEQDLRYPFWRQLPQWLIIFLLEGEVFADLVPRTWTPRPFFFFFFCKLWLWSNGRCWKSFCRRPDQVALLATLPWARLQFGGEEERAGER